MTSRLASAHSHRTPSSGGNVGRDGSLEDRFQRLQQENTLLKIQRNELEDKLKDLKTKFRRLLKDIKMTDADVDRITGSGNGKDEKESHHGAALAHLSPNHQAVEISMLNQKVASLTAQLQMQLDKGSASNGGANGASGASTHALQAEIMTLKVERMNDQRLLENSRNELARLQEYVSSLQAQQQQHNRPHDQVQQYQAEINRLRERANADARSIENLVRERDSLGLQVRLLNDEEASGKNRGLDPLSLIELQSSINDKATQITVLTNRLSYTQTQVNTLRSECERLVEEMRNVHNQHADVKKQLFDAQHQNAALAIRCDRMNELEQALLNKNEELLKTEQEVLKLIDKLQSCSRDTELQVRREMSDRINELEAMRDEADKARRSREKEVMVLQQELSEVKRRGEIAQADLEVYRKELEKLQGEKQDLAERSMMYGTMSTITDVDDDVHKALAMANIRRRAGQSVLGDHAATATSDNRKTLDMWEGMAWNDEWEAGKLREALATAALNMELAETRCMQLSREAEDRDSIVKGISHERDVLLEENIEMRRRISNVQTMFAKQQLEKYRESLSSGQTNTGSIVFTVTSISCDPKIQQMPDGSLYSPSLFLSLDGLEGYHTMLSGNFYSVSTTLDTKFSYEALHIADTTVTQLQRTTFSFQLHQSFGLESIIVGIGEISGAKLLTCRDGGTLFETVSLISGNGEKLGDISVCIDVRNLFLPVLLDRPLTGMLLTADAVRTALIALRAVRALRIQVFKATNLCEGNATPPRAYVFYTALPIDGITCLPDTTVAAQDAVANSNPIFDVVPRDFPVVLDRALVQFIAHTQVTFVIFDHNAQDVKANIGMAVVPLKSLLKSPSETILVKEKLHPSGEIEIGFSWVSALV